MRLKKGSEKSRKKPKRGKYRFPLPPALDACGWGDGGGGYKGMRLGPSPEGERVGGGENIGAGGDRPHLRRGHAPGDRGWGQAFPPQPWREWCRGGFSKIPHFPYSRIPKENDALMRQR